MSQRPKAAPQGYQQPPQETQHYSCTTGPGADMHGQMPPTDEQAIQQRKRLAGDPAGKVSRQRTSSRQYNRGGY